MSDAAISPFRTKVAGLLRSARNDNDGECPTNCRACTAHYGTGSPIILGMRSSATVSLTPNDILTELGIWQ